MQPFLLGHKLQFLIERGFFFRFDGEAEKASHQQESLQADRTLDRLTFFL